MIYKDVKIIDNVYGGYGLGRLNNGKVVFIPFTVTGDTVDIQIKDEKKSFAYGEIVELKTPSKYRKEPTCKYVGKCGGCSFGFIEDNFEKDLKKRIVENIFRDVKDFKIDDYLFCEKLDYRIRCRMKMVKGELCYKKFNSNEKVSVEFCPILKDGIFDKLKDVANIFKNISCDISIIENEKGEELIFLDEEIDLINCDYNIKSRSNQKGLKNIEFNINNYNIPAGYGTFFQTNRFLFNDFQKEVLKNLENLETVFELYCGSGFFTIPLSHRVRKIVAVDSNDESLTLLKRYANSRVETLNADLCKGSLKVKGRFDAVLVDPDRKGLTEKIIHMIIDKRPEIIVYVSCNPTTMARDIKRFLDNYKIDHFKIIDQFYKTYHIESIAVLKRF